ncbi:MAG: NHL repeat-containing protein [Gammaproteobacteria bacterium]|nr:NHL repeat-containing protein [Gammaproteobacteria bacterium]
MKILKRTVLLLLVMIALMFAAIFLFWMPSVKESPYQFVTMWGQTGNNAGEFRDPTGLAVTENELFVSDSRNGRIQVFDHNGIFLRQFSGTGQEASTLKRPMNLALLNDRLYVADYWQDRIFVFTLAGELVRLIGEAGSGPGQFNAPGGLAVASNGDLYIADFYNQRVQQLNNEGGFIRQWGTTGKVGILSGQLNYPTDVAVSRDGRLFVADGYNDRIQVFSSSGEFITRWGGPLGLNIKGPFNGWFQTISSIEVDGSDFVYAADFYNSRVQKFTADGDFVNVFGEAGDEGHQFDRVVAIAVTEAGTVFVSDFGHNRIQKWQSSGGLTEGQTP